MSISIRSLRAKACVSLRLAVVPLTLLVLNCAWGQYRARLLDGPGLTSTKGWYTFGSFQGGTGSGSDFFHAMLWTPGGVVDLQPSGYSGSQVTALASGLQGGEAEVTPGGARHAMVWHGTPESAIDLNPQGYEYSTIFGGGDVQVGSAKENGVSGQFHPALWRGTVGSFVDLNPPGFYWGQANDSWGDAQVGWGKTPSNENLHALLWHGSAASAIDLTPSWIQACGSGGICGDTEVGGGEGPGTGGNYHALVWHGSAASTVDIHPSGFNSSFAHDVVGDTIVGTAGSHAFAWLAGGSIEIDLQQFLVGLTFNGQPVSPNSSVAWQIDQDGNIVGWATDSQSRYGVVWQPIRNLSGSVTLGDFQSSVGEIVRVEIRTPGSTVPVDTESAILGADGSLMCNANVSPGTYDIAVKGSHWLRQVVRNVNVGIFGAVGLTFSLTNGDVNGDNAVTLGDFAALKRAYGSGAGDPNWNPDADLNGDGSVTLGDFAILRAHYGQQGDD
jgi:hypothetical protein